MGIINSGYPAAIATSVMITTNNMSSIRKGSEYRTKVVVVVVNPLGYQFFLCIMTIHIFQARTNLDGVVNSIKIRSVSSSELTKMLCVVSFVYLMAKPHATTRPLATWIKTSFTLHDFCWLCERCEPLVFPCHWFVCTWVNEKPSQTNKHSNKESIRLKSLNDS